MFITTFTNDYNALHVSKTELTPIRSKMKSRAHLSTANIQLVLVVFRVENDTTRGSRTLDRHEMRTGRS